MTIVRPHRRPVRGGRRLRTAGTATAPVVLAVALLLALPRAAAAFVSQRAPSASSFGTATLSLTDDDGGTPMANPGTMTAAAGVQKCIQLTYTSAAAASVKLYATIGGDASVPQYTRLVIEEGTGGTSSSCASFSAASTLITTTLNSWTAVDWSTGLTTWSPSGTGTRSYRFTFSVTNSPPSSQQGLKVTFTPTWEARAGS